MVVVTQNRQKCIGCNYCVELAPEYWRMSKRDGKSVLLGAREMKGQHTLRLPDDTAFEANQAAARACPVHIIQVRQV